MKHLFRNSIFTLLFPLSLMACSGEVSVEKPNEAEGLPSQEAFLINLKALCGQTYKGAVVSQDSVDADWRAEILTLGPVDCSGPAPKLPLAVGADTSRVWTVSMVDDDQIKLSHAHTLKDGSPDPVTGYGGTAANAGTALRQDFPVDDYSIQLFLENGLEASITNVWSLEIVPAKTLTYELNREGRHFRAVFDISSTKGGN